MADTFTPEQITQILEEFFKVVGTRKYIGERYVPIFGRKGEESIQWDNSAPYEPLTIVLYQGNSYTSRQYVPIGVEITNQDFWVITGNYNAQVEAYHRETITAREIADNAIVTANNAQTDIDTLLPKADFSAENTVKKYIDEKATVQDGSITTAKLADGAVTDDKLVQTDGVLSKVKTIYDSIYESVAYVNGFDGSNLSRSDSSSSPFVIDIDARCAYQITSIKINVKELNDGTLTIGKAKKPKIVVGEMVDTSVIITHETLHFEKSGVQTVCLDAPMLVNPDEYVVAIIDANSIVFYYGPNGTDRGFYYKDSSTAKWKRSGSSLNMIVYGNKLRASVSTYDGKTLSILGDSISTFSGYIPEDNLTYYPSDTVTTVTDTWWYKLMTALGMTLDTNNSWSGSRVTTTAGDASAGCMTRCQNLGASPDVIIVWMGINDFNSEVALGTYDGMSTIPTDTTTFREAYGIMLDKILTKYQTSEVWVCTLPQCERNSGAGFPEINEHGVAIAQFNKAIQELADAFGVKVLDHNKCGLTYQNMPTYNPDNLHPNKDGHSLVANNDIRQMDSYIGIRY